MGIYTHVPNTLTTHFESGRNAMMRLHVFTRPKFSTKNEGGSIEIRARRQDLPEHLIKPADFDILPAIVTRVV